MFRSEILNDTATRFYSTDNTECVIYNKNNNALFHSKNIIFILFLIISILLLTACGGGGGGGDEKKPVNNITGQLIDDPVSGLSYQCTSGVTGRTSAEGKFTCQEGDSVSFYLGPNTIGPVPAINALITPYSFFPNNETAAINLARLLQSIDADNDPSNGVIVANTTLIDLLPASLDFSNANFSSIIRNALGISLIPAQQAQQNLNKSIFLFGSVLPPDSSQVPVADAGANRNVFVGEDVVINASASTGPEGSVLIYGWSIFSKPEGSNAALTNWNNMSSYFTADVEGEYIVNLIVISNGFASTDKIIINANNNVSLPAPPKGVKATAGDTQIMVFWNGVSNADLYRFYWNTTGGVSKSDNFVNAGANFDTEIGHINLTNGTAYYYRVSAINSAGESGLSLEVSATPTAAFPDVPAAPRDLLAQAGDMQIDLSWSPSISATGYSVYWNNTGGVTTADNSIDAAANTQLNISGLTNGTFYYYRVAASNETGEGLLSAEVLAVPDASAVSLPEAPQSVTVETATNNTTISWAAVSGASSYTVYWSKTAGVTTADASLDAGNNTQVAHTSLTYGDLYYYRVSASNSAGEGPLSSEMTAVIIPTAPKGVRATVEDGQVSLAWKAVNGAGSYTVYWNTTGNVSTTDNVLKAFGSTQIVHTGLQPGTSYYYRVLASNMGGDSALSEEVVSSQPVSGWLWVKPLPQGNDLRGTSSDGSQFVSVGTLGVILTSTDGTSWKLQMSGTFNDLNSIVWDGLQFIAVGGKGTILTSPDAIKWTAQSSGSSNELVDIVLGSDQYVVIGKQKTLLTSADSIVWSSQVVGRGNYSFNGIAWNGSLFVAITTDSASYGTYTFTSTDGVTWDWHYFYVRSYDITADGNQFVIVGYGDILTSTDGLNWTPQDSGMSQNRSMNGVTWDGNQFFIVGSNFVLTSPDAVVWTETPVETNLLSLSNIFSNGNQVVASGASGVIIIRSDGINWNLQSGADVRHLEEIAWSGKMFVAVGWNIILSSPDGITWTERGQNYTSPPKFVSFSYVTWSNNMFIALSSTGSLFTSPDGITWTAVSNAKNINDIIWDGSQYVGVGDDIITSSDGITWTTQVSGVTNKLNSITSSGSLLVAVGNKETVMTSTDGVNWATLNSSALYDNFDSIAWGGNQFVVSGSSNGLFTSKDGISWTFIDPDIGPYLFLREILWTGDRFVANLGFYSSSYYTSSDGASWTKHMGIMSRYNAYASDGTQLVVVGNNRSIARNPMF